MKLLVIGVATLLPQLAMADFCTIYTRNNPAYADECRKQGAAGGAEFHQILSEGAPSIAQEWVEGNRPHLSFPVAPAAGCTAG